MSIHTLRSSTKSQTLAKSMALNLADWQASSVQHFGVASHYTDSLWWRQPGGSGIYLAELIHDGQRPDAEIYSELEVVKAKWGGERIGVYDCWGKVDLAKIGLRRVVQNPWYWRAPATPP